MRAFGDYNPRITAMYFAIIIGISMFCMNPVLQCLSFLGGLLYFVISDEDGLRLKTHAFYGAVFFITALINPLVSHNGVTVLLVVNDNPITLEAVIYGVFAALAIVTALYWFRCFSGVMTSDKLLYICGGLSPRISLVISMSLRFVPLFRRHYREVRLAQTALGVYKDETFRSRLKGGVAVFSSMVTWALENGIVTADSMTARGYGTGRRSFFSDYKVRKNDLIMLFIVVCLGVVTILSIAVGALTVDFYPAFCWKGLSGWSVSGLVAFGLLCFIPVFVEIGEKIKWHFLTLKI